MGSEMCIRDRETIGRVAAGSVAKQLLTKSSNTEILAWVKRIHDIEADIEANEVTFDEIEKNIVRCPNQSAADLMIARVESFGKEGDSCGGVIECIVRNPPAGLGMPVFDKLEADLAKALMSLPATKGFEVGSGFAGTYSVSYTHLTLPTILRV